MFRTASRLPRRTAFLSATVAGTVVAIHEPKKKLSIYPPAESEILLVETPLVLEKEIGDARKYVLRTYGDAHAHVQGWVSKWIGVEHAFESRVKSIISPEESMTPGLLYAGVAGLTGSILARNRILPTRLLLPPIFLFAAASHFLPKTTGNLSAYLGDLEDTYFPVVAQKHEVAKAHSAMTWDMLKDATQSGRAKLDHGVAVALDKVQETTGLKLKETLGWQKEKLQEAEKVAEKQLLAVKDFVVETTEAAEKKVEAKEKEDVKRLV